MFDQSQPAPAPGNQGVPSPTHNSATGVGFGPATGSPTVVNPALGPLGTPVQMPQMPSTAEPYNPYQQQAPAYQQAPSPYAPMPQANPYGAPAPQQSPYAAQPNAGYPPAQQVPAQQQPVNPWQTPQQPNPYAYNPYPQAPAPQPIMQPQAPAPDLGQKQITAQALMQQPGGMTEQQISEVFPDQTSRAIFQGMSQIAGPSVDLLAAFGSAYERRDMSLVNERYLAQFDPQMVNILRGQFGALMQAGQSRDAAVEQSIYQMAGGRESWDRAVQAFNTTADKQTVDAVVAAVNSGDPNQVHLAVQNVLRYNTQQGNMIQRSGQMVSPNGAGQASRDVMTNDAFRQHLAWLEQAHPVGSPQYNQHYQQLVEQRKQAKAQGY